MRFLLYFHKLFNPTCYLSNLSELSRAPEASDTTLTCWCWLGWMMTLSPPQLMSHIKSETLPAVPFSPFPPYYMNKVGVNTYVNSYRVYYIQPFMYWRTYFEKLFNVT